jgi:alkylhydroperoxidase/carboxymuconolactone decarboxylase family protein YurZ
MSNKTSVQARAHASSEERDAWESLVKEYPQIAEAISSSVVKVLSLSGLDEKTRQLVYIATQTAVCYPLAMKYHVPLALKAGATKDEIVGAAAIAAIAAGPKGFVTCFPVIVNAIAERSQ